MPSAFAHSKMTCWGTERRSPIVCVAAAGAAACRVHSVFWANMSVGETVLQTVPLTLDAPLSVYDGLNFDGDAVTQVQQQQITAALQLLCTGEVEEVRGDAGTFPQSLSSLQPSIYHPKGMLGRAWCECVVLFQTVFDCSRADAVCLPAQDGACIRHGMLSRRLQTSVCLTLCLHDLGSNMCTMHSTCHHSCNVIQVTCCLYVLTLAAGFVCRWELLPNQPDVLLSVDYRGLLPDESITLELAPNNIIRLETPDGGPGAVFQASTWVDSSILVSFQSTRTSTDRGED